MECPHTAEVTTIHVRKLSDPAYLRVLVDKKLASVLENLYSKGKFKSYFGNLCALPITAMSPAQDKAYNSHLAKISAAKIIKTKKTAIQDDFHVENMLKTNCFYHFKTLNDEKKRFTELTEYLCCEYVLSNGENKKVAKERFWPESARKKSCF